MRKHFWLNASSFSTKTYTCSVCYNYRAGIHSCWNHVCGNDLFPDGSATCWQGMWASCHWDDAICIAGSPVLGSGQNRYGLWCQGPTRSIMSCHCQPRLARKPPTRFPKFPVPSKALVKRLVTAHAPRHTQQKKNLVSGDSTASVPTWFLAPKACPEPELLFHWL